MSDPEPPYGPGALCGDCGHFAARHVPVGCHTDDLVAKGISKRPCQCRGFKWNGVRWYGDTLQQRMVESG